MDIVIHLNTFYSKDAEGIKMDVLEKIEQILGYPDIAVQEFENEEEPEEGFDVYLKYSGVDFIPFKEFESLAVNYEIYVLVIDLNSSVRYGFWFDEEDEWVEKKMPSEYIDELIAVLKK
jgi:hypothetical protein